MTAVSEILRITSARYSRVDGGRMSVYSVGVKPNNVESFSSFGDSARGGVAEEEAGLPLPTNCVKARLVK